METKPLSPLARHADHASGGFRQRRKGGDWPVRPVKLFQPANRLNRQNRQTSTEEHHEAYMRLALQAARRGMGQTSPNPAVGAVLVKRGRVIATGYHRRAGLPHAEIEALKQAGIRAHGSTMYVTLEPCNHVGRTPPCCDALIAAGVKRVVIAMNDPNPLTNGRGIACLRRAGIQVDTGVLKEEAKRLNAPFAKWVVTKMPWVIAKVAQSLDGKIATRTGESRWISSTKSRHAVHRLRRHVDAIVVGVKTVLQDDPLLSARNGARPVQAGRPIKVIVDSRLRTPLSSRCVSSASPAPTIMATTERAVRKRARFEQRGIRVLVFPPTPQGRVPLKQLFRNLAQRFQITSVLIEGGGEVLASAFQERLVDRLVWCIAPIILGGRRSPPAVGGEGVARLRQAVRLTGITIRRLGDDLMVEAGVAYSPRATEAPSAKGGRKWYRTRRVLPRGHPADGGVVRGSR